jgi:two-component system, LytTR family, sensor kinase
MQHPVFYNIRTAGFYFGSWILILGIQFFIAFFQFSIPFLPSLVDNLVFNLIFSILGIPVWYIVRYTVPDKQVRFNFFFNHLISLALIIVLWLVAGYSLMNLFYGDDKVYAEFQNAYRPFRLISGVLFYVLLCLAYYLVIYYGNLQEKIKAEAKLNELLKDAELMMLRSQINPHFLFNSLNSISSLTITNPEKAQDMVIKLSEFLRYSISFNERTLVPLEKEFQNIERYLEIEKVRFGNRIQHEWKINGACNQCQVPVMLLQPLYENAVKHGVYESMEPVKIITDCALSGDLLRLSIENDFDPSAPPRKGSGIGLRNIRERLRILYQENGLMEVKKEEKKFRVTLTFPVPCHEPKA